MRIPMYWTRQAVSHYVSNLGAAHSSHLPPDSDLGAFLPSTLERYLQILLPTLRLCAAILSKGDVVAAKKVRDD